MNDTKICPKCKQDKPLEEFHICKGRPDGRQTYCIPCRKKVCAESHQRRYKNNPEYKRKLNESSHSYRQKNKDKAAKYQKKYYKKYQSENQEEIKKSQQEWRLENKEHLRKYWRKYRKNRRKDIAFRLLCTLQCRLWFALRASKSTKADRTIKLVGCSTQELKTYIEKQFRPGMSWENYGEWHIDHIRPCASFNLKDPDEQRKCFHFTNLQPLWATTKTVVNPIKIS